jgi:hypothetical protein
MEREDQGHGKRDTTPSTSRLRRWLDRRRDRQRHAAEMGDRAYEARKQDEKRAARHGRVP